MSHACIPTRIRHVPSATDDDGEKYRRVTSSCISLLLLLSYDRDPWENFSPRRDATYKSKPINFKTLVPHNTIMYDGTLRHSAVVRHPSASSQQTGSRAIILNHTSHYTTTPRHVRHNHRNRVRRKKNNARRYETQLDYSAARSWGSS